MTDIDETPLTEADLAVARLNQDLALAETNRLRERISAGIQSVRDRLTDAGFVTYKHYELRHPLSGLTFGSSYAGGEYAVTLTGLGQRATPVTLRLTTALIERDPAAVDRLGEIILNLAMGAEYQIWTGAGNVVYGLWVESGDPEGVGLLFGERYTEADEEYDPAERAQLEMDEGPPDMSGPGNPSGEGR